MSIEPDTLYFFGFEISAGQYYINPDKITVESPSYVKGYTTGTSDAWGFADAYVLSETDVIDYIEILDVIEPVVNEKPGIRCNVKDTDRLEFVSIN